KMGSISDLLEAPRRKRDRGAKAALPDPKALAALDASTLSLLRRLAIRSLESLGVRDGEKYVEAEMLSKFDSLAGGIAAGADGEARLREAISLALEQLDE
ncbi:MAG: hypothetical protein ABJB95_11550, partial [Gemmatimonadales bacterium]